MPYQYSYKYFALSSEAGTTRKSHIMRPHTEVTMCGWEDLENDGRYKLAYDLRQDCSLCALCLDRLHSWMDSRGTDAVSLHVFKALVDRLQKLEAPD